MLKLREPDQMVKGENTFGQSCKKNKTRDRNLAKLKASRVRASLAMDHEHAIFVFEQLIKLYGSNLM